MSADGKIRVIVRSKRVPVRTVQLSRPIFSASGFLLGSHAYQGIIYDSSLDESYRRAIKEARKVSCNLDLDFEVVDASKAGILRRLISRISGGGADASFVLSA